MKQYAHGIISVFNQNSVVGNRFLSHGSVSQDLSQFLISSCLGARVTWCPGSEHSSNLGPCHLAKGKK